MSKKIWRGRTVRVDPVGKCHEVQGALLTGKGDCTVVSDSALFPVNEARALCKAVVEYLNNTTIDNFFLHQKMWEAEQKYLLSVERMKKKAGSK